MSDLPENYTRWPPKSKTLDIQNIQNMSPKIYQICESCGFEFLRFWGLYFWDFGDQILEISVDIFLRFWMSDFGDFGGQLL